METEKAIQASRQEYLQNLIRKRQEYLHECNNKNNNNNNNQSKIERQALLQEWLLEKKRDFLIKHFPGVDLLKLNRLFRFYGQQNAKLLATTFPTAEYIINGNSKRNVTTDLFTSEFLP